MKISVIGLGYIGLPTALMLAAHGNRVVGTDHNRELLRKLAAGERVFEENGLDELFRRAIGNGIEFSDCYQKTEVYIIAVPTPYSKKDKRVDASCVTEAFKQVCRVCPDGAIVVIESTVSPGTTDRYLRPAASEMGRRIGGDIHLVHAPERIIPGNMIYELEHNARTIGADRREIGERVRELYRTFCDGDIVVTDIRTAEMTKVVENTYRDINIAFANELAKICRSDDMDVYEIIKIANQHPRVAILSPGPGVGGHCISVDPWFLVGDYPGLANLVLTARKINDSMPEYVLERAADIMREHHLENVSRVGLYGLTYKEDVDDIRESPTLQLLDCMRKHLAAGIQVYDPFVKVDIVPNQYHELSAFLDSVDLVIVMVGHSEIREQKELLRDKIVLDTRNTGLTGNVYRL